MYLRLFLPNGLRIKDRGEGYCGRKEQGTGDRVPGLGCWISFDWVRLG